EGRANGRARRECTDARGRHFAIAVGDTAAPTRAAVPTAAADWRGRGGGGGGGRGGRREGALWPGGDGILARPPATRRATLCRSPRQEPERFRGAGWSGRYRARAARSPLREALVPKGDLAERALPSGPHWLGRCRMGVRKQGGRSETIQGHRRQLPR